MIRPQTLEKLRTFDTPTICNIIELFDVRPYDTGYMDNSIAACFPEMPPMVGFASTMTFRSSGPPLPGQALGSIEDQVDRFGELSGPAVVVIQDLDVPSVSANFGDIMCTAYKAYGATGLIASGPARDLEPVRALDLPVFANGANPSHAYYHFVDVQVPVRVAGLAVYPNDLLHGDRNGVTSIPADIAAEVADVGDAFVAAEVMRIEPVRSGRLTIDQLTKAREACTAEVQKLRAQVSRKNV